MRTAFRIGIFALILGTYTGALAATEFFRDDFAGSEVNQNLWQVIIPGFNSELYQTNGMAVFVNQGQIITRTDLPSHITVQGRFRFVGNSYDQFAVYIRTDGAKPDSAWGTFQTGIAALFQVREYDQGQAGVKNIKLWSNQPRTEIRADFQFELNTFYIFKIVDDGTNVHLYVQDMNTPILGMNTSYRAGYKLGVQNREGIGSISRGSTTELEYLSVNDIDLNIHQAVELEFYKVPGRTYQILSSGDLIKWITNGTPILGDGQVYYQLFSTRGTSNKFYRVDDITPQTSQR